MQTYIARFAEAEVAHSLEHNPVTAILGPRQCGKSTLAQHVLSTQVADAVFLDLELPSDLRKLADPELFLERHSHRLVCIDEVQHTPDLFRVLRALVDRDRRAGRFLVLGSASRDLIRQSSETLAGRIHYVHLAPFDFREILEAEDSSLGEFQRSWWRGGFPPALLENEDGQACSWLRDFVQAFVTRDLPELGFSLSAATVLRFWRMLAHYHGAVLNSSKLGQSLGVSHNTVRKYVDILEQTFMLRVLAPLCANVKKRLVKSPKVYIRDTGVFHSLLELRSPDDLYGHPQFGASWEGWCIEQIVQMLPDWRASYYRTSSGEEVDLVLERGRNRLIFECKASSSPRLSKGFSGTLQVLNPDAAWIVCPLKSEGYPVRENVRIVGPVELVNDLRSYR